MNVSHILRFWLVGLLALVLLGGVAVEAVQASTDTFNVSVYHGINGRSLVLSKDLPVNVEIWKDGALLITLYNFTFGTRIDTSLPAGEYEIRVFAVELGGARLDSMTVDPVEIPAGVDVSLHARLSAGKTPIIAVGIR